MKKILFISIFIISCNSNKIIKPIVCVERVEYYEPTKHSMNQPSVLMNIKVEDSAVYKKLERGQLNKLILYSIKKEDRDYLSYEIWRIPTKTSDGFSFIIRTGYFSQNISDIENHKKREWSPDKIINALNGDVGFVFDKDTILAKSCSDKKMIIQMIN